MAAFSTLQSADARAQAKMADHTWVVARSFRNDNDGRIGVRVLRWMPNSGQLGTVTDIPRGTVDSQNTAGSWDELFDDSQV